MSKVDEILNILPQTQCGLCSYKGCRPYAEAIVHQGEAINRCPPGGVVGLIKLAELTGKNPAPFLQEMAREEKPWTVVSIREEACIGCTKCIQACPVDAIIGSGKLMHSVITDECSGCDLCLPACPVDCIDIIKLGEPQDLSPEQRQARSQQFRTRYEARETRLAADQAQEFAPLVPKKNFVQEALARAKARKTSTP